MDPDLNIPHKANRILNLVLLAFVLILLRTWYLGFAQGDYHKQQARKPQRRSLVERIERATIRDRFNAPLAQNTINYAVAIRYGDMRQIPAYTWEKLEGKKTKKPLRTTYISSLASFLSQELSMERQEIEDIIYAKASLFPQTPFVIKESLTEQQYYKLKALEKEWLGMEVQRNAKRIYPKGKVACDVIGYMGAISPSEYIQIAKEIGVLENYIQKRERGEVVFLPKGIDSPIEARNKLALLKKRAYTINDSVGKTGIEGSYDAILRGVHGKKNVEVDPKGNIIREFPSSQKGLSGQRIFLSISSELQEYAEALLAEHEELRDLKDPGVPWIKGGAIVVLDPKTGDILTLASYPRTDPNDFIQCKDPFLQAQKQQNIGCWMENESHIGSIWNGENVLMKEIYSPLTGWKEEKKLISWPLFLETILPKESAIWAALDKISSIKNAYILLHHFEKVLSTLCEKEAPQIIQTLYQAPPHKPCRKVFSKEVLDFLEKKIASAYEDLNPSMQIIHFFLADVPHNDDKLLTLDLIRLLVVENEWSSSLLDKMGHFSLEDFFSLKQALHQTESHIKTQAKQLYHNLLFPKWREQNFKDFLSKKRAEEKAKKTYTRPYTDYLNQIEKKLFGEFWSSYKHELLQLAIFNKIPSNVSFQNLSADLPIIKDLIFTAIPQIASLKNSLLSLSEKEFSSLVKACRSFTELTRPLYGKYPLVRNTKGVQLEKHLAGAFYPLTGFGFGRSQAFKQSTPQGSLFKLIVAYEALKERYEYLQENALPLNDLNPLTLVDDLHGSTLSGYYTSKQIVGYTVAGDPIRRLYKGGVLPRSSHAGIGKIDLIGAIEQSSNIYFSLLAAEHIADPSLLEKSAKIFGYGSKTGIELPGEISGHIPGDLSDNKSGLYAFAIGQHSLVATPLQAATMLASLGNKGKTLTPHIVKLLVGNTPQEGSLFLTKNDSFAFSDPLRLIGINFPLFTESLKVSNLAAVEEIHPEIKHTIFLPEEIRQVLLTGMDKVVRGTKGSARLSRLQSIRNKGKEIANYNKFKGRMVGKTGTAEILYKQWIDAESTAKIHNHVWFGGLVFPTQNILEEEAELAIVVYLRFSKTGGKEAAPIVTKLAEKWEEIKKKYAP